MFFNSRLGFTYVHEGEIEEGAKYYEQAIAIAEAEKECAEKLMKEIANYTLGSVPSSIARPEALRWLKQNKAGL